MNHRIIIYFIVILFAPYLTSVDATISTPLQYAENNIKPQWSKSIFPISVSVKTVSAALQREQDTSVGSQETSDDSSSITRDEVNMVARELWCPLCSGVRLDVCELQACNQMREEIAIQLAEGADTEDIKAYFLAQYGPQILGEPPRSGFNALAWIVPFIALLGVGAYLIITRRPKAQTAGVTIGDDRAVESDRAVENSNASDAIGSPTNKGIANQESEQAQIPSDTQSGNSGDLTDYERLLDQELEEYE